jgi:hypothetical protein
VFHSLFLLAMIMVSYAFAAFHLVTRRSKLGMWETALSTNRR